MRGVFGLPDGVTQELFDAIFQGLCVYVTDGAFCLSALLSVLAVVIVVLAPVLENVSMNHGATAGFALEDF